MAQEPKYVFAVVCNPHYDMNCTCNESFNDEATANRMADKLGNEKDSNEVSWIVVRIPLPV